MKWWLAVLSFIIVVVAVVTIPSRNNQVAPLPSPSVSKNTSGLGLVENEDRLMSLATEFGDFRVAWEILDFENVRIGVNPELDFSSQQLMDKYGCKTLTSAAFYDTDNQPLGLLVDQGATLSAWRPNRLLHGVIGFLNDTGNGLVVKEMLDYKWQWAVQAGPIVWQNGEKSELKLTADQEARRVMAAKTNEGKLVLMAMVAVDSLYLGPRLENLPRILEIWQQETGIILTDAINLDGGTASAFLSPTLKLKELKPIGSYICGF